jgi:hypothetical protein
MLLTPNQILTPLLQLNDGDHLYLALREGVGLFGFRFEQTATPCNSPVKRDATEAGHTYLPDTISPTKKARGDAEAPAIFKDLHFVFWEQAHMARAMKL